MTLCVTIRTSFRKNSSPVTVFYEPLSIRKTITNKSHSTGGQTIESNPAMSEEGMMLWDRRLTDSDLSYRVFKL